MTAQKSVAVITVAALCVGSLLGCATHQETGRPFDADARKRLVIGSTTVWEASALLGPPLRKVTAPDGSERLVYEHTRLSATPRVVPFWGRVHAAQTPHRVLELQFADDVLADCRYFAEEYRSEGTALIATRRVQERCGDPAAPGR